MSDDRRAISDIMKDNPVIRRKKDNRAARVRSLLAEAKEYRIRAHTFQSIYKACDALEKQEAALVIMCAILLGEDDE